MKRILFVLLILNLGFSAWLYTLPSHDTPFNYLYNLSYGLNFALAAIANFSYLKKCLVHRKIHLALGFGAISYLIAQGIWVYYNIFFQSEVPYPSFADLFFMMFNLFVVTGIILIMVELKIKFTWSKILEIILISGIIFLIINSFIQSVSSQEDLPILVHLLNYSYPFFDAFLTSLVLASIRSKIGSLQPLLLYFMATFLVLTFADTLFSYQTSVGNYWNGNFVDAFYAIGGYLFAMGVVCLPKILHANDSNFSMKI